VPGRRSSVVTWVREVELARVRDINDRCTMYSLPCEGATALPVAVKGASHLDANAIVGPCDAGGDEGGSRGSGWVCACLALGDAEGDGRVDVLARLLWRPALWRRRESRWGAGGCGCAGDE
jgi:hypothetical protein